MNGRRKRRGGVAVAMFVMLTVVLSLILVGEGIYIYSQLREDSYLYALGEADLVNAVNYEEYYRLYSDVTYNVDPARKRTDTENELRALGFYYQAASLYKAYTAVDDKASAAIQLARMQRYRAEAGKYAGEADKIDERLAK